MPKIAGNAFYYETLERECLQEECSLAQAEINIFSKLIRYMRLEMKWTHTQIQQYVEKEYGMKKHAYYNRLHKVRTQFPAIP